MKNRVIKIVSFLLVFCILFSAVQYVLQERWDMYARNNYYYGIDENSIDVLCFGTSEVWAGYSPIVMYEETGVTGFNYAINYKSALVTYYQVMDAIKYQAPKVVLCDFASLYDDSLPGEDEALELMYCEEVDSRSDWATKRDMINSIMSVDKNRNVLYWYLPLLRHHTIWNHISARNFLTKEECSEAYYPYSKGAYMESAAYSDEPMNIEESMWDPYETDETFSDISVKYYDLMIEECQKRGIKVAAFLTPKLSDAAKYSTRWPALKEYFDSRGVDYFNYNTFEQVKRMGLSVEDHYYNTSHLNTFGSVILTRTLADDLVEKYGLQDHRGDKDYYDDWDAQWQVFRERKTQDQPNDRIRELFVKEIDSIENAGK